jgi:DeoR/GlpR family transcriptional regulator of sugar metabolism
MPSPKHSASTGTQQPNTADSQGPADLDFIMNFNAQIAFKSAAPISQYVDLARQSPRAAQ